MEADIQVNEGNHVFCAQDQGNIASAIERLQAFGLYFTIDLPTADSPSATASFVGTVNTSISQAGFAFPAAPPNVPIFAADILLSQLWRVALPRLANHRWILIPNPHAAASTFVSKIAAGPSKLWDHLNTDRRLVILSM